MIMVPTHVPRENNVHYTQIVWKNSVRMGCAKVRCDNGQTFITCIATMTLKEKMVFYIGDALRAHIVRGLTGSNAAVAVAVAGVCGCGRLRFLAVLRDLYDWNCG
ncbi:hypothetical protein YC2023_088029 [Brassica napus]